MTIPGYLKGNYSKHWIDYESARVADAFIGAVQSHYPNNFISLKDKNLETLAERLDKVSATLLYLSK